MPALSSLLFSHIIDFYILQFLRSVQCQKHPLPAKVMYYGHVKNKIAFHTRHMQKGFILSDMETFACSQHH